MTVEIKLPKLSETMEEGTLLRWLKHQGDQVNVGDVIAEIETDKADMELEAEQAGILQEARVQEGESVTVGTVLAILGDGSATVESKGAAKPDDAKAVAPAEAEVESEAGTPSESSEPKAAPSASSPKVVSRAVMPPAAAKAKAETKPEAKAETKAEGATKTDAKAATKPTRSEAEPETEAKLATVSSSKLRAAVAKQMVASKRDIPHFYVTAEIDMSEAARLRQSLKGIPSFPERLTFTHMIMRALALTLPSHPRLNAAWTDEGVVFHDEVHLGIAVAVEDGLLAPVLRDCHKRSLRNIARAATQIVEKAQSGRSSNLTGATFTISNLGMLDIEEFSAVITPPQAAILAVGAIRDRAIVRDGQLAIAKTMRATVSADHRILTGYEAGRFLEDLKKRLEAPALLLLTEEDEPGSP